MSYRNRKRPERKRYWPWFASMLSSFLMEPAHIEGIGCENLQNFRIMAHQIGVTLGKLAKLPVKMGGGSDGKRRRHVRRRLRAVFLERSVRNSANNASPGRVLPARMSSLLFRIKLRILGSRVSR